MVLLPALAFLLPIFQESPITDPKATEVWEPVPKVVRIATIPSDAIDLSQPAAWARESGEGAFPWKPIQRGFTVTPGSGGIKTRQGFGDCQLHIEWMSPPIVRGEGQGRGNSGIFFMQRYELQVLDSYNNATYVNGQAGSIYKQHAPLVNASKAPGEWQSYDVIFTAPRFNPDGSLAQPARMTALHNGVLILNNAELLGPTEYIGKPVYKAHAANLPIGLQDHGDLVSYRNIWIRKL